MKDKKTEKDLSILDNQDAEIKTADKAVVSGEEITEVKEKTKVKPWIIITSVALIIAIIAVGVFAWYQYTTLATYDGGRVTRAELDKYVRTTLLAQGVTEADITDMDGLEDSLLVSLANEEVFYQQLKNYEVGQMTAEEITALEEDSRILIDEYVESNTESIAAGLEAGYTDKDLENAKKEFELSALNQIGCENFQDFVDIRVKETIISTAYEELIPLDEITPTDAQIQAKYDALLAEQTELYSAEPATYLNELGQIDYQLYVPEGIRMVRHILMMIDEESSTEIYNLEAAGNLEEAEVLHAVALEAIEPQMTAILEMLDNGEMNFTDAIEAFNEDQGMSYYPDGYEVCEGYAMYVDEFTEASLALSEVGEYSGLVSTTYGYHIIEYYKDVESSTIAFEEVSESMAAALLEENRSERWYTFLDTWPVELNLKYKDEALSELDVYN